MTDEKVAHEWANSLSGAQGPDSQEAGTQAAFDSVREDLVDHGYAVVDTALGSDADIIYEALARLDTGGALRQHLFAFKARADASPQAFEKPNIFEAELQDVAVQMMAPDLVGEHHAWPSRDSLQLHARQHTTR